jgi:hypothetical protein
MPVQQIDGQYCVVNPTCKEAAYYTYCALWRTADAQQRQTIRDELARKTHLGIDCGEDGPVLRVMGDA